MANSFTKTVFVNGQAPALSAEELNKMGQGIEDVDTKDWIPNVPLDPNLNDINEGQIWRLTPYDPPEFKMKIGDDKYHINLRSLMTKYPKTGVNAYTGVLFENGVTPMGKTVEIGPQPPGNTNSVTFSGGSFTMAYYVQANNSANAYAKVSFGTYDISLIRSIKVTFRVISQAGNEGSDDFLINCSPAPESTGLGTLPAFATPGGIGSTFTTVTRDVSTFLGWAEISVYCGTAYSNAGFANGMTVEVSKVELIPM